ncbi:serine/threonine protein kinase [Tsukamurella sp. PLM1]|uniref:serine/threonine protein kinase n=1 Tax=Tsukamurella sp. PLM1 TaxID=2929795 RepID=UPI00206B6EF3|nr:serine/threonine protein kinase [Tsukamurella sp. PLM1]BDH59006.1 hypothetical protein MTP03_39450 [Tsukamurella sp. PLM1]
MRFNREADLAATLFHPNIVGVHDRGESGGKLWLSMDYVAGTDLDALVRDRYPRGLPVADVVSAITQVAGALDHAHGKGLIHRDVKPANILLAESGADAGGRVLLADFGIARRMDDDAGLTATNMAVGTVTYAAPEQLADEAVDGRADQYALAATALTLLTGRNPFTGTTPGAVISRKMRGDVPRAAETDPRLAPLDRALSAGMAADPARRFRTCADFARALEDAARTLGASGPVSRPTVPPPVPQVSRQAPGRTPPPTVPPQYGQTSLRPAAAPLPAYGSHPSMPVIAPYAGVTKRPWQVTAAGVLCFMFAPLAILGTLGGTDGHIDGGDISLMMGFIASAVGAVAAGVLLMTKRSRSALVVASVAAALMTASCVGVVVTVPVLLLLWAPQKSRLWFGR